MTRKRPANGTGKPEIPRFSDYLADAEREERGEWIQLSPPLDHVRVLLRSPFCPDYQRILGRLVREQLEATPEMDTTIHLELVKRAISEVAIVSYEGLLDDQDRPIEHSQEFLNRLMFDRACHHYSDAILSAFQGLAAVKRREREAEGKESAISSDIDSLSAH